jgi:hypothetical protein
MLNKQHLLVPAAQPTTTTTTKEVSVVTLLCSFFNQHHQHQQPLQHIMVLSPVLLGIAAIVSDGGDGGGHGSPPGEAPCKLEESVVIGAVAVGTVAGIAILSLILEKLLHAIQHVY